MWAVHPDRRTCDVTEGRTNNYKSEDIKGSKSACSCGFRNEKLFGLKCVKQFGCG